ncbi:MAG: M28 family peptidase [Solirubrobacteraceae bacterium]|nr:M28 family peptidase [Solirubrobacteraceae bacterium]
MIDPRIYRAALVPVLFAFVLLAFSLENRPQPMRTTVPPDAFQGQRAFDRAYGAGEGLAERFPDRRPGSTGDARLASTIAAQMEAAGFLVQTVPHEGRTIDGRRSLRTVIAQRPGTIDERIVVVAHRDAAGRGARAELSATAALLELARIYGAPRQTRRTLTLVSTSGGSGGAAGATALADELSDRSEPIGAVLVLGDLASRTVRAPLVTSWSNALGASPQRLRATAQEAVRVETGSGAGAPRALSQFARFALPATFGEQGALLARGLPAVLLSIGGDQPPAADAAISRERLEAFGRAALRTVTVLDAAPAARSITTEASERDLLTSRKILPLWAVRLFTGALLLTVLVTAFDAFAALLRRREPIAIWLRWTLANTLPFVLAAVFAAALGAIGLLGAVPGAPVAPQALAAQPAALLAVLLVLALAWVRLRPVVLRALRADEAQRAEGGAGVIIVLIATAVACAMWITNPYAAALLIPALHIWLFALSPELRMRRAVRVLVTLLGVVPIVVVAITLARSLGLNAIEAAWQLLLMTAGGHISPIGVLLWSLVAGCASGALLVATAGRAPTGDDLPITVRGPRSYAGPGSLGGTDSALRR